MMFNSRQFNSTAFNGFVVSTVIYFAPGSSINRGFKDMILIKNNETSGSRRRIPFDLILASDRMSGMTGESVLLSELKIYINGGTEAVAGGSIVEIGGGLYYYEATASEVAALGQITVRVNHTNAVPFKAVGQVVAFDPYDSVRYGLSSLPNSAPNAVGGIITFGTGAGQMYVNGSGGGYIALDQPVAATDVTNKNTQNVGDCLSVARAEGAGKWSFAGTIITVYGPDAVQVVRSFTVNDPQNPTQRS